MAFENPECGQVKVYVYIEHFKRRVEWTQYCPKNAVSSFAKIMTCSFYRAHRTIIKIAGLQKNTIKKDTLLSTADGSLKTDGACVKRPPVTPKQIRNQSKITYLGMEASSANHQYVLNHECEHPRAKNALVIYSLHWIEVQNSKTTACRLVQCCTIWVTT